MRVGRLESKTDSSHLTCLLNISRGRTFEAGEGNLASCIIFIFIFLAFCELIGNKLTFFIPIYLQSVIKMTFEMT